MKPMNIEEFLRQHGQVALFVALLLEEAGIPMPVPTDVLVIVSGYLMRVGVFNPLSTVGIMQLAANIGASLLYLVMRRGGRPLINRYGRYIHLNETMLVRSEQLIGRLGWWGIAVGRAIPGVRYATVISCGLFGVGYWRFLSAQIVGTSVNMLVFLSLGWFFGPHVVARVHGPLTAPELGVAALGLLALLLIGAWLYRRSNRPTHTPV